MENYQKNLERTVFHDKLTGAMSRHWMHERILEEISLLERKETARMAGEKDRARDTFSIALFDLDNFKKINDIYGHNAGDIVLQNTVKIVKNTIRLADHVSRWGGEEFLLLFRETNLSDAQYIVEKIKNSLANSIVETEGKRLYCTASFGITEYTIKDSVETIVHRTDRAMYEAKNSGKNRAVAV